MHRKVIVVVASVLIALSGVTGLGGALAHECPPGDSGCQPTAVAPNWRDGYIPLFGLEDREDAEQRRAAQRWRDEHGCDAQHCTRLDHNTSVDDGSPTGIHAVTAADHSMFEVAHSSEGHETGTEGNHDAHGGAVYADVCASSEAGTSNEDQAGSCTGTQDTQVGVTLVDHNACIGPVPYVACTDEYHVVRPLDPTYTQQQMANSQEDVGAIGDDTHEYLCGREPYSEDCAVPAG